MAFDVFIIGHARSSEQGVGLVQVMLENKRVGFIAAIYRFLLFRRFDVR